MLKASLIRVEPIEYMISKSLTIYPPSPRPRLAKWRTYVRITMNWCHCYFNLCYKHDNSTLLFQNVCIVILIFSVEPNVLLNIYMCVYRKRDSVQTEDIASFLMALWHCGKM